MPEPLAEVRVHADVFGQQDREASDALDVGARVLVAELDGHRQALNRLGLGDLELRQRAFELARAMLDLVLERDPRGLAEIPTEPDGRAREHDEAAGDCRGSACEQSRENRGEAQQRPREQRDGLAPVLVPAAGRPAARRLVLRASELTHARTDRERSGSPRSAIP